MKGFKWVSHKVDCMHFVSLTGVNCRKHLVCTVLCNHRVDYAFCIVDWCKFSKTFGVYCIL